MTYPVGYSHPHPDAIDENMIVTAGAVVALANIWQEVGRWQVPAGEAIELGLGNLEGHDSAVGRVFIQLFDVVPAQITGRIRLVAFNSTQTVSRIVFSMPWQRAGAGLVGDIADQRVLSATDLVLRENEHLVLQIQPDAAAQGPVVLANSTVIIDCMRMAYDPAAAR